MDDLCTLAGHCLAWLDHAPPPRVRFIGMTPVLQFTNPPGPRLEVCYLEQGTVDHLQIGDQRVAIPEGWISVHNLHFGNQSPPKTERGRIWCLILDAVQVPPALAYLGQRPVFAATAIRQPLACIGLFQRLRRLCSRRLVAQAGYDPAVVMFDPTETPQQAGSAWRLKGLLLELFGDILDAATECHTGITTVSEPIQQAQALIEEHFTDPTLNLAQVAQSVCLSVAHFGRRFTREIGCAPMAYLQQLRLREAAFLLRQTGQRIDAIAEAVGYHDPLYFSKLFHRAYGMSPRAFRATAVQEPGTVHITRMS